MVLVFSFIGAYDYFLSPKGFHPGFIVIFWFQTLLLIATLVFYYLSMMNPGYVEPIPNFTSLLVKLIENNYHLDYVCIPCGTLRPEEADHCNFCNRCVQKFDHHCVFIDNCIGYRNHKWFLLFLVCFSVYMVNILVHSIWKIVYFAMAPFSGSGYVTLNWIFFVFLIVVVVIHAPIVIQQLRFQCSRLCRKEEEAYRSDSVDELTTNNEHDTSLSSDSQTNEQQHRSGGFSQNLRKVFSFRPQSQMDLYEKLFGDTSDSKQTDQSKRWQTTYTLLEVVSEELNSKMEMSPTDPWVAGGSVDQTIEANVGVS